MTILENSYVIVFTKTRTKCTDSQLHQHIEPLQAGNRHIPSASFASPSMAPLTADVDPSAVLLQGRHDAAAGTSRSPAFPGRILGGIEIR
jgi:hypothetical protein